MSRLVSVRYLISVCLGLGSDLLTGDVQTTTSVLKASVEFCYICTKTILDSTNPQVN